MGQIDFVPFVNNVPYLNIDYPDSLSYYSKGCGGILPVGDDLRATRSAFLALARRRHTGVRVLPQ